MNVQYQQWTAHFNPFCYHFSRTQGRGTHVVRVEIIWIQLIEIYLIEPRENQYK